MRDAVAEPCSAESFGFELAGEVEEDVLTEVEEDVLSNCFRTILLT